MDGPLRRMPTPGGTGMDPRARRMQVFVIALGPKRRGYLAGWSGQVFLTFERAAEDLKASALALTGIPTFPLGQMGTYSQCPICGREWPSIAQGGQCLIRCASEGRCPPGVAALLLQVPIRAETHGWRELGALGAKTGGFHEASEIQLPVIPLPRLLPTRKKPAPTPHHASGSSTTPSAEHSPPAQREAPPPQEPSPVAAAAPVATAAPSAPAVASAPPAAAPAPPPATSEDGEVLYRKPGQKPFKRLDAWYQCTVCSKKYFTKNEVEACFNSHPVQDMV